jgi:hypothetical protein
MPQGPVTIGGPTTVVESAPLESLVRRRTDLPPKGIRIPTTVRWDRQETIVGSIFNNRAGKPALRIEASHRFGQCKTDGLLWMCRIVPPPAGTAWRIETMSKVLKQAP